MKVLILGETGMLGNAVHKYFVEKEQEVETLPPGMRWPSNEMKDWINNSTAHIIINCIGAIPQKKPGDRELFELNTRLPLFLFSLSKTIIHAATDCEFSGKIPSEDFYDEDDHLDAEDLYGISKAIPAEAVFNFKYDHVKMIRASIVGIELKTDSSLLNWFLTTVKNEQPVTGYTNHYWNGITTLEWAKVAFSMINEKIDGNIFQVASKKLSKYELLQEMASVFKPGYAIAKSDHAKYHNKCLSSKLEIKDIRMMLQELKDFYQL